MRCSANLALSLLSFLVGSCVSIHPPPCATCLRSQTNKQADAAANDYFKCTCPHVRKRGSARRRARRHGQKRVEQQLEHDEGGQNADAAVGTVLTVLYVGIEREFRNQIGIQAQQMSDEGRCHLRVHVLGGLFML